MKTKIEPYRLFFPLGIFYGIWGVLGWISYFLDYNITYPIQEHFKLMTYGFMFSFICGFVMTATPKQTQSIPAAKYEVFTVLTLLIINTFLVSNPKMLYASTTLVFIVMNLFIYDRYRLRKNDVDSFFIFIRLGFLIGLIHSLLSWITALFEVSFLSVQFMKMIFYDGFVLLIVLGVGSTLIPNMFGYKQFNIIQIQGEKDRSSLSPLLKTLIYLLLISFLFDLFITEPYAMICRFFIVLIFFNSRLHIFRLPPVRTGFTISVWISVWMSVLGYGLSAFFPAYYIHSLHLMLIGGFGLMVILIAARVTLAHGNHGFDLEVKSSLYKWIAGLIILAAFTRFTAIFWENIYVSHLGYAAIIWALTLVIWSIFFFKKMLVLKNN